MKLAIIGSRNLVVELSKYIADDVTEIVSGSAQGIDTLAKKFAIQRKIKLTEFLPEYNKFKRNAPLIRNKKIVDYADAVLAFWDGKSAGTKFTINYAQSINKAIMVYTFVNGEFRR